MNRTLIVIRHAHRDKKAGADQDNGLSEKGRKQAARLARFYASRYGTEKALLLSSPKLRCLETLEPIARDLGVKVRAWKSLDEEGDITGKISSFLREWEAHRNSLTVICSHGDWIPEFFESRIGIAVEFGKGAWAELERTDSRWIFRWLVQDLKEQG